MVQFDDDGVLQYIMMLSWLKYDILASLLEKHNFVAVRHLREAR